MTCTPEWAFVGIMLIVIAAMTVLTVAQERAARRARRYRDETLRLIYELDEREQGR